MSKGGAGIGSSGGALTPGALAELFGTAAYVLDERGCVSAVNEAALRLLHRSAVGLVGHDPHDVLHRDSGGQVMPMAQCQMRQGFLSGRSAQGEGAWLVRGDGSLIAVSWTVVPCAATVPGATAVVLLHEDGGAGQGHGHGATRATLTELERLALLAETTSQLTSTLDVEEALHRLVRLVVPRLADWAVVDLLAESEDVRRAVVAHFEDGLLMHREDLEGPMPRVLAESPMPLSRALRGAASALAGPATYQGPPDSGIAVEQRRLFEATGMHSAAIAPIRGLREVLGALTLGRSKRPEAFTSADLALLEDITRRTGLALDNARLYQRQRKVAETMQRHLLPQLPTVPGLQMAARYLAAPDASQVGGDWYDAFLLSDGSAALAIGDVVGHDLDAAAGMAQVRNMLRAYAWFQDEPPSVIVDRLDQAVLHLAEVPMVTMIFARLKKAADDGSWELSWTNAGHPPPLLVSADGQTRFLTEGHGLLLSTGSAPTRTDALVTLPPGSTLVLYTDGLVESRHHPIDHGLDRMRKHAAALAHRPLDAFTDLLLERLRPDERNDDDIAVLTCRPPAGGAPAA